MLMGSNTIKNIITKLDGDIEFINRDRLSKLTYSGHKKIITSASGIWKILKK